MLDLNQLLNWYITTNTSLSAHQSKCFNIFNINVNFIFICLCILFFVNTNLHIVDSLGFCSDGFINICIFRHRLIVSIWNIFGASISSAPYLQSSVSFKIYNCYIILLGLNGQPNETFYHFYLCSYFWINLIGFIVFDLDS